MIPWRLHWTYQEKKMVTIGRFVCVAVGLLILTSIADAENKNVLFLTKSSGFQHSVITRDKNDPQKPAYAERLLTEFGGQNGFTVTVTKDADVFNDPETYKKYYVFAFYTTGDLTKASDKPGHTEKAMSEALVRSPVV